MTEEWDAIFARRRHRAGLFAREITYLVSISCSQQLAKLFPDLVVEEPPVTRELCQERRLFERHVLC